MPNATEKLGENSRGVEEDDALSANPRKNE